MNTGLGGLFRALARGLRFKKHEEETTGVMNEKHSTGSDRVEVENAITAFKELISRLSRNGTEIGELYLSAERKAARYALLSETVIESVTSGILVVDDMHQILLANSAAKRALGCDENIDLTGRQLGGLFEEYKHLQALVSKAFRSSKNSTREVVGVTLHGGAATCLGVSTSCVISGDYKPEAVIIVFTLLDKDATGMISGQAGGGGAAAEAYRKGMLDAYGIVSEVYLDIEGLRAEIEGGRPDVNRLADVAERVEFACDLMVGFALSKVGPGAMTELVDLNEAVRKLLEAKGLSGRRVAVRLGSNLPRVSTVRRVLDAGLDVLLKGCLAESAEGVELVTSVEGPEENPTVNLRVTELSPTLPIKEIGDQPRGFLEGRGFRRELGLMLLQSLPAGCHGLAVTRNDENFVYSLSFLLPKLRRKEKESTSGGITDGESSDGDTSN